MQTQPRAFRLIYRSFEHIEFDPAKSDEVFEARGFDLGYVSRIFPGYVLEREDSRPYSEPRFQVIGELSNELYFVVYTPRGRAAVSSRHGLRNPATGSFGMTSRAKRTVRADLSDPNRGRFDPARIGRPNPNDTEPRPVVSDEDFEATRAELDELRRRMLRQSA